MNQPLQELAVAELDIQWDAKTCTVPEEPLVLKQSQEVIFRYPGREGATLLFPRAGVFSCRAFDLEPGENGAPHEIKLKVRNDAPVGEFAYAIYSTDNDDFAEAASPPRMIIEENDKTHRD